MPQYGVYRISLRVTGMTTGFGRDQTCSYDRAGRENGPRMPSSQKLGWSRYSRFFSMSATWFFCASLSVSLSIPLNAVLASSVSPFRLAALA